MLALMQERDSSENTVAQYTQGLGLESMRRDTGGRMASGDSSFFHYDALGSTQELTDANEDITDTYRYNAWGQVLVRTGTTTNPHTYVGKERYYLTPDPLLYLLGLRYYELTLGRFITLDPATLLAQCGAEGGGIGQYRDLTIAPPCQPGARGLYDYAGSMPTRFTDPLGLYILHENCNEYATDINTAMFSMQNPNAQFRDFMDCLECNLKTSKESWMQEWKPNQGDIRVRCGDDQFCRILSRWSYGFGCGHSFGHYGIQLCFAALHEVYYDKKIACDYPNMECVFMHEQIHLMWPIPGHAQARVKKCWDMHLKTRCPGSGKEWKE